MSRTRLASLFVERFPSGELVVYVETPGSVIERRHTLKVVEDDIDLAQALRMCLIAAARVFEAREDERTSHIRHQEELRREYAEIRRELETKRESKRERC